MSDNIQERLKKILVDLFDYSIATQQIDETTSLYGRGLGLSSIDAVSLIARLEEEFDIFFAPAEITPSLETFGTLLRIVQQKDGEH